MFYHIIRKIYPLDGELVKEPVGYVTDKADADYIEGNSSYRDFMEWVGDNITNLIDRTVDISDYFEAVTHVYDSSWKTTDITGIDISEITDLDNPEGV
jgi:hypothetical protein